MAASNTASATPSSDVDVSFEEYLYWASVTRAEERRANEEYRAVQGPMTMKTIIRGRFAKPPKPPQPHGASLHPPATDREHGRQATGPASSLRGSSLSEKTTRTTSASTSTETLSPSSGNASPPPTRVPTAPAPRYPEITEAEWKTASRAFRTAGWGSVFYLVTTDILGPGSTPWAFAQMGYGPGIALFTVFGIMSLYSGWILWKVFLGLDSDRYPLRTYADVFFRLFGPWARHAVNAAQALQLLLLLSVLILSSGQSIAQMSKGPGGGVAFCFVACLLVFMIAGFLVGQIRTLQRLGWLANFAVWVNLTSLFIVMGLVTKYPPNFAAIEASFGPGFAKGPIRTFAGTPPDGLATGGSGFVGSLNGLNQAVYSYGGAMLFVNFLSEMRHPLDFWKGLLCAEIFIYAVYLTFGLYVYSRQGQYSFLPVTQGISDYGWQTALNVLGLLTGLIAAALYGNIGLKVVYIEVFEGWLGLPAMATTAGKIWWATLVPVYWGLAFVIAAGVPQLALVSGFIGALFILSFTYTFPASVALGYWIKLDARVEQSESFDPQTRCCNRVDRGTKRWIRGFRKRPAFHVFNLVYLLGAAATCALGCYSAVVQLMTAFDDGVATSFTCKSPV
ncbi:hypothetical protein VTK73DRAFT_3690 [Phialemonium thermophilum]|uniref:Amino acid transporter transmembrane domain-containing protein n=1 Tax=Phialemonium thermophilum TaxID=223376 RepID=A0ABR3WY02_9PEZI